MNGDVSFHSSVSVANLCGGLGEVKYRRAVLNGAKESDLNDAFATLRKAVELSEKLKYDEPWVCQQNCKSALCICQQQFSQLNKESPGN